MKFSIVFTALVASAALLASAPTGADAATLQPRAKSCKVSSQCDLSKNHYCKHGKCSTMKKVGSACYKNQGCLSGLCYNKKCISKTSRPVGATCSTSDSCKTGYCRHGKCDVKKPNGNNCYKDAGCKSGYCNTKGKCGTKPAATTTSHTKTGSATATSTVTTQPAAAIASATPSAKPPTATGVQGPTSTVGVFDDGKISGVDQSGSDGTEVTVVKVGGTTAAALALPAGDKPSSITLTANTAVGSKMTLSKIFNLGSYVPAIIFSSFPQSMAVTAGAPISSKGCQISGIIDGVEVDAGEYTIAALKSGDQAQEWTQREIQSEGSIGSWSVTITCDAHISASILLADFSTGSVQQTQEGHTVTSTQTSATKTTSKTNTDTTTKTNTDTTTKTNTDTTTNTDTNTKTNGDSPTGTATQPNPSSQVTLTYNGRALRTNIPRRN